MDFLNISFLAASLENHAMYDQNNIFYKEIISKIDNDIEVKTSEQNFLLYDLRLNKNKEKPTLKIYEEYTTIFLAVVQELLDAKRGYKIWWCIATYMESLRRFCNEITDIDKRTMLLVQNIMKEGPGYSALTLKIINNRKLHDVFPNTTTLIEHFVLQQLKIIENCIPEKNSLLYFLKNKAVSIEDKIYILNRWIDQLMALAREGSDLNLFFLKIEVYIDKTLISIRRAISPEIFKEMEDKLDAVQIAAQRQFLKHGSLVTTSITCELPKLISQEELLRQLVNCAEYTQPKTTLEHLGVRHIQVGLHDVVCEGHLPFLVYEHILMNIPRENEFDLALANRLPGYAQQISSIIELARIGQWRQAYIPSCILVEVCLREIAIVEGEIITTNNNEKAHFMRTFTALYESVEKHLSEVSKVLINKYFINEEFNFRNNAAHGLLPDAALRDEQGFIAFMILYTLLDFEF